MSRRTLVGAVLVAVIIWFVVIVGPTLTSSVTPSPSAAPSPSPAPTPAASQTVALSGPASPAGTSATVGPSPSAAMTHVWWIAMENHEYGSIVGDPAAAYLNSLAARYGVATDYHATGHPSEPNYIAMVAGATLGVTTDGVYDLTAPSLFSQLADAGLPWRAYEQGYPGGCFTGDDHHGGVDGPGASGTYVRKHDPAISFTSVSRIPAQCADIQPLGAFEPAVGAFEFITPNLINDMHDGTVAQGDAFLRAFVPMIVDSAAFRSGGVLFITFDEGTSNAGAQGDSGGHVATFIVASGMQPGLRDTAYADHYSLLHTAEQLLGLPCLAGSCSRGLLAIR
ncbi:MAG: alkaline phosphatase family protein [Candidatus Limnocylindrales bacterium]